MDLATGPGTVPWQAFDPALVAPAVAAAVPPGPGLRDALLVGVIDPDLADTAAFCARYGVGLDDSANCVVVAGRRAGETSYAACLVLATTRADVNGLVRRRLEARKASFAAMDEAVGRSGMEYGGITPIGLPADWPVLVDAAVLTRDVVVIGSGLRRSKLAVATAALADLPGVEIVEGLAG